MSNSVPLLAGKLAAFVSAYKSCRKVQQAKFESGYALRTGYPPAGFYVYALIDPVADEIFYIGKGIGGRVLKHEERTRRGVLQNKAKVKRIQEIFASGREVERRVLFCSESEEVTLAVEDNVIHELAGFGLTNIIGGVAVTSAKVRRTADVIRERLDRFRAGLVTE